MKLPTSPVVAMLALMPALAGAFTLDAAGYSGSELSAELHSVFVPGYGEVVFQSAPDDPITLVSAFLNDSGTAAPPVRFDASDAVKITFDNVPAGETSDPARDFFMPRAAATMAANRIDSVAAPESGAALIGVAGAAILALRRRR